MKIDTAIREFTERYDREAMSWITRLSNDFGLNANHKTIKLFNINEAFQMFTSYLNGYGQYKIVNKDNTEASSQTAITESVSAVINDKLLKDVDVKYSQIPDFVKGYTEGVKALQTTVQDIKGHLMAEGISPEYVGDVSIFADQFISKMNEAFYPAMDHILGESGYLAHKSIHTKREPADKHVFL